MNFKTALWEKCSQVNGFKLLKRKEFEQISKIFLKEVYINLDIASFE